MTINIDYLDLLYADYFDAVSILDVLEKQKDFPDDENVIQAYRREIDHAKRNKSKSRNRIYAYIEHHGASK